MIKTWVSALIISMAATEQPPELTGFAADSAVRQVDIEARFDAEINRQNIDDWMKYMSSRPHHAGSPFGKELAIWMRDQFRSWGYQAEIETYHVLLPTPRVRELEMIAPDRYTAALREPDIEGDSTTPQRDQQLPSYNAFSPDGDVTAEVVFVGQGLPADYEQLDRLGISVEGKVVLARYGGSWRGIKPKMAAEKGALATLIYTDPEDDGYSAGDVYPTGGWRPMGAVQRGSVLDLPKRPGDPLTPYVGATEDARRIDRDQADNLISIPVLPISARDALPILEALGGPVAPERTRGTLPITYHVGPGPATVHLKLAFNWDLVPAHNVIARWPGSERPDEWVMRGNHHDAWVNGATDPVSGMAALMEEARVLAKLAREGQPPRRTVLYAAWDAEEPALLGSTEWVEDHRVELQDKLVAYINSDSSSRGFLYAGGSHTLQQMMGEVADAIADPSYPEFSVAARLRANARVHAPPDIAARYAKDRPLPISALGSGSDYSAFLQHAGIASLNLGYGGESDYGVYHSNYDSYEHFVGHMDPGFLYAPTQVKTTGRATLRLANAELLPFRFSPLMERLGAYLGEINALIDDERKAIERHNDLVASGAYRLAADPRDNPATAVQRPAMPAIDLESLSQRHTALATAAQALDILLGSRAAFGLPAAERDALNRLLYQSERQFIRETGLPRRPWFRHHIYAPGYYTGYGVKTLPGVREAIEEGKWDEARQEIADLSEVLDALAAQIGHATALLKPN